MTKNSLPKRASRWSVLLPAVLRVPILSERLVARFFVTPMRRRRDEEFVTTSLPETSHIVTGRRPIYVRSYGEGRPVFVVHGWGGESRQMRAFVEPLVRRGYRALLIDLPSHGKSPGKTTNVIEARDALLAVARQLGEPHAIVAHSFGAAAAAVAHHARLSAAALVFVAPLPSLEVAIREFAARARLPEELVDRASRRVERRLALSRSATNLVELAKRLRTPLLIVHDAEDKTIPLAQSQALHEEWEGSRLVVTEGLGHSRLLVDASVTEAAAAFIERTERSRVSDLTELFEAEL